MAVRKTVGVSERTFQIEAGGAIDRRQAFGLRLAEWMRARDSSGKTSLFDLKLRADARVNAQALGQRLQQQIRRARKQDDEMTRALMPAEPIDGFRRQTRLDLALEAFPRQAPETDGIFTAQVGFYRVQSRSARGGGSPPGGGSYGCDDPVDHIPPTQFAAPSEKPDEDSFERRIGDERAVNIENCSNPSFVHFSNRPQVSAEKSEALDDHRDAARDHDHRNPECDQSRRREVDPEDALDNPVRRDVESRSGVARATFTPRHNTVNRVERERDDQ